MSKQRKAARAEREAAAVARAATERADAERAAEARARAEWRRRVWAQVRLWQHAPGFRHSRTRERLGQMAIVVLLAMVVVFVLTRSWSAVFGTALVAMICAPVLAMLFFDRSRP